MAKRRVFGISESLSRGFTETFNAVTNNAGTCRFEIIALSRVETDPENPRELKITASDILHGLKQTDPDFGQKQLELNNLETLSGTIKKKGIINPVVVYKYLESYRLVAGERRYLASLLAGKDDIQAKVLNTRPNGLDLKLLQWIENTEREELSLKDRIGNVQALAEEYKKVKPEDEITPTLLKDLICVSLPQATYYFAILAAPNDVKDLIHSGQLNNLDKAAILAKVKSDMVRKKAISVLLEGGNIKDIKALIKLEEEKEVAGLKKNSKKKKAGKGAYKVNMGITKNSHVVKSIVLSVVSQEHYKKYAAFFTDVDWNQHDATTKAFRKLIDLLEKSLG